MLFELDACFFPCHFGKHSLMLKLKAQKFETED